MTPVADMSKRYWVSYPLEPVINAGTMIEGTGHRFDQVHVIVAFRSGDRQMVCCAPSMADE